MKTFKGYLPPVTCNTAEEAQKKLAEIVRDHPEMIRVFEMVPKKGVLSRIVFGDS